MGENTKHQDWTRFTRHIHIDRPVKDLYDAWTIPSLIETWFLERADYRSKEGAERPKEEHAQVGDVFEWKWWGWDNIEKREILEANGKDKVAFTFADGIVTVNLTEKNGRTHIELVQSQIATDETSKMNIYCGCSLGWSFWMVNLKAWLEHGITLNDKNTADNPYHVVNS